MQHCRGLVRPTYSKVKYTSINPFYLPGNSERIEGVNTTDEFIVQFAHKEVGFICMDCGKEVCTKRNEYGEKEEEIS